jgi:HK97 gp10 family phage protein
VKISAKIEGDKRLLRKFQRLEKKAQGRILVKATRPGAKLVLDRARELAPVDKGTLAGSGLQLKVTARRKHYGETSVTNTRAGAHAILQEFGVQPHSVGGRAHPGHPPQPFMRPAFDENVADAQDEVGHVLKREILDAAR